MLRTEVGPSLSLFNVSGLIFHRKIDGIRLHESAVQCIEAWKQLSHSNIVPLREMFASNAFDNVNSKYLLTTLHNMVELTLFLSIVLGVRLLPWR